MQRKSNGSRLHLAAWGLLGVILLFAPGQTSAHCDGMDGPVVRGGAAGREYVKAYVGFIHYVGQIYEALYNPAPGHSQESGRVPLLPNFARR